MDFLNHGSFGATPRRVLARQTEIRCEMERQPLRFFNDKIIPGLREAAEDLGELVGARGEDIAFVDNATTGANAVLRSFPLESGDEVLITNHSYGAVTRTVEYVTQRSGASLVIAELPFPGITLDACVRALEEAISPKTRLVVLDHITSATGLIFPIQALVDLCRERGVPVLVDGAHGPGMVPLNLTELGADWYAGNCHKWLCSAKGCAFLWTRKESEFALHDLHPTVISHGFGQGFTAEFDFVGTKDYSPFLSLPEALAVHRELGPSRIQAYNRKLVLEAGERLCRAWGTESVVPEDFVGSILTLPIPQFFEPTEQVASELTSKLWAESRIEVPFVPFGDRMWLRISAQIYNELTDYERLADVFPMNFPQRT